MKTTLAKINSSLDIAEENMSVLEVKAMETFNGNIQRETQKRSRELKQESVSKMGDGVKESNTYKDEKNGRIRDNL